jgi:hypothetical protein
MGGDWFKMLGDVVDALGAGDDAKRALNPFAAYAEGRSMETEDVRADAGPYVYERRLTRPRDPGINDR